MSLNPRLLPQLFGTALEGKNTPVSRLKARLLINKSLTLVLWWARPPPNRLNDPRRGSSGLPTALNSLWHGDNVLPSGVSPRLFLFHRQRADQILPGVRSNQLPCRTSRDIACQSRSPSLSQYPRSAVAGCMFQGGVIGHRSYRL